MHDFIKRSVLQKVEGASFVIDELSRWKDQFILELEQLNCVLTDQVPGYKLRARLVDAEVARGTVVGCLEEMLWMG